MRAFFYRNKWYFTIGAACLLLLLVVFASFIKSLAAELDAKFYAAYDSVPTRVYSNVYWLRAGVGASAEELRFRLKEREYKEVSRADAVMGPGMYFLEAQDDQVQFLRIYLQEFNYPDSAKEVFFGDPKAQITSARYDVQWSDGRVEHVISDGIGEVPGVALEPTLIAQLNEGNSQARRTIPLGQIPHTLMKAVVLIEDQRFLEHGGIDPRGILRSVYVNLKSGSYVQGASTITQQLARNIYLTRQKTITRKLKEMIMSVMLEFKFSKDQILEKYLNEVYLGQSGNIAIHGVSEAAKFYFAKSVEELSVAEQAMLAGIVRGPFYYSPFRHFDRAKARQELVLKKMRDAGVITEREYARAVAQQLRFERVNLVQNRAPYFTDMVQAQLLKELPEQEVIGAGYTIFSTLDTYYQGLAEEAVSNGVNNLENRLKKYLAKRKKEEEIRLLQGAFVSVDPVTGHLLAIVGGRSYEESNYNRVLLMKRQIGSLVKPFVYLAALMYGKTEDGSPINSISKYEDKPFTYEYDDKSWSPKNYEEEYAGVVTLRYALSHSINTVAAQVAIQTGLDKVVDVLRMAGLETPIQPLPSVSLGAMGLPPMEVATAYTTLANFGLKREITSILLVVAENGHPIARYVPRLEQTLPPEETANLVQIMTSVFDSGTASASRGAGFLWPAAGKTGTTNDFRDAWFAGFTQKMIGLSWVGFDRDDAVVRRHRKALRLTGAVAALPVWTDFMRAAHKGQAPQALAYPDGALRSIKVDLISGARANHRCMGNSVVEETFTPRNIPLTECE